MSLDSNSKPQIIVFLILFVIFVIANIRSSLVPPGINLFIAIPFSALVAALLACIITAKPTS